MTFLKLWSCLLGYRLHPLSASPALCVHRKACLSWLMQPVLVLAYLPAGVQV